MLDAQMRQHDLCLERLCNPGQIGSQAMHGFEGLLIA